MVRRALLAVCIILCLSAGRCGGSTDDVARQFSDDVIKLAQRFNTSDDAIRNSLDDAARRTGASREELASQWRAQPNEVVVIAFGDEIAQIAQRQGIDEDILRAATCSAIEDVLVKQELPTADGVATSVQDKLLERLPVAGSAFRAQSAANDVGDAMSDIDEGFPAGARLRLLMLKFQHC